MLKGICKEKTSNDGNMNSVTLCRLMLGTILKVSLFQKKVRHTS